MARTRVQSIAFVEHNFDSRWGFAVFFESIAKPQRECHKCIFDGKKMNMKGNYNGFRSAHKKNTIKTDCFGAEHAEGPNTLQKQWFERPEAPTPQWEADFGQNQLQMRAGGGDPP